MEDACPGMTGILVSIWWEKNERKGIVLKGETKKCCNIIPVEKRLGSGRLTSLRLFRATPHFSDVMCTASCLHRFAWRICWKIVNGFFAVPKGTWQSDVMHTYKYRHLAGTTTTGDLQTTIQANTSRPINTTTPAQRREKGAALLHRWYTRLISVQSPGRNVQPLFSESGNLFLECKWM